MKKNTANTSKRTSPTLEAFKRFRKEIDSSIFSISELKDWVRKNTDVPENKIESASLKTLLVYTGMVKEGE